MPLILAIRNDNAIVFASDSSDAEESPTFGECMVLPNRVVVMIAGNLDAIRGPITDIMAQLKAQPGAAEVAQVIHAELNLTVVPDIDQLKGRVEFIVAGFDIIHREPMPSMYYMDSAQDFDFNIIQHHSVAGGATAAITGLLNSQHDFSPTNTDQLQVLAKECLSATKLKWPLSVQGHVKIGVIFPERVRVQIF